MINVCFILELNLNTKQHTASERTHLFIIIKFIKKNKEKKQWNCRWEKMSRATEENKLTVTIKILLYLKFMCTDKNKW